MLSRFRARSCFCQAAILLVCIPFLGCGPELTTPGETDVSGTWFAAGPAAGLSDITMILEQAEDGHITGTFTATGTQGQQACPTSGLCLLASTVNGANTVLQVNLELKTVATFTGQVMTTTRLRGTVSGTGSALIEFLRTAVP
jgi:hypothetical protein